MAVKTWAQLRTAFADNNTGAITAGDLRDLIDTLEEEASRRISIRVQADGTVLNRPGGKPITGTNPSTGRVDLKAPAGYIWQSATAVGNNTADHRRVNIEYAGTNTLRVTTTTNSGTLINVTFYLEGTLIPA